ncbi:MAG TPA: SAM-dependent methyltransferase [Candidatus Babeliales bacterium]|nr:SAM-dependent methyltransferase [Candidatus Babeliales bacterium]
MSPRAGSLSVVGVGIRAPAQATLEGSSRIRSAEKVFSLVTDPLAEYWLRTLNNRTQSLCDLYSVGKDRFETYCEMVDRIMGAVREGLQVCVVAYGHPGVAAYPLHESVRRARIEGFAAEMLAGISAEDCLFAELGIDPIAGGCCSYEATDFLLRRRSCNPGGNLILWQVGVIAERGHKHEDVAWNRAGLAVLTGVLLETYPPDHEVVIFEAARLPACESYVERVALRDLPEAGVTAMSTLFVPPMTSAPIDDEMSRRLGLREPCRTPEESRS